MAYLAGESEIPLSQGLVFYSEIIKASGCKTGWSTCPIDRRYDWSEGALHAVCQKFKQVGVQHPPESSYNYEGHQNALYFNPW